MKKDLIITLYGSTGDLTFRKLLPALIDLKKSDKLPDKTMILAIGRRDFTNEDYFNFLLKNNPELELDIIKNYIQYFKMEILVNDDYIKLEEFISAHKANDTRIVHYLAVASNMMLDVAKNLSINKVVLKNDLRASLIFEKPFGTSYLSAKAINFKLLNYYSDAQIYRIDHYLGKNFLDQMINFRFNHSILSPILNPNNLKSINIDVIEKDGVLNRGAFYDETGALRDMFQSHILQTISLLVLNKPKSLNTNDITKEKIKALKKIRFDRDDLVFGQYRAYTKEDNVNSLSTTETMFKTKIKVNNKFKNVDVNVLTGKNLSKKYTNINYILKDNSEVNFNIYPDNEISIKTELYNKTIILTEKINYSDNEYGTLLHAAINYEKDKFISTEEIEVAWKISDDILSYKEELEIY